MIFNWKNEDTFTGSALISENENSIVISCDLQKYKHFQFIIYQQNDFIINNTISSCSLRMKNGNQNFLFYMMKYYISHLLKKESGTVFGSVNRNDINGLEVDIPEDAQVQKKIARYLEMIDDKIELTIVIYLNFIIDSICTDFPYALWCLPVKEES